ncbi:MAG: PorV/PorQ family protein [Candidatus Zixiibacteriota bacterium]
MGNRISIRPLTVFAITALMCAIVSANAHAQTNSSSHVGTTSANFLKMGVGARASALGGAFVAIADDATAGYWNAAGLVQIPTTEITFMHNDWYLDIKSEYLGAAFPVSRTLAFGLGISYLDYGSFDGYDSQDQPTGSYSANAMVVSSSGSIRLTDQVSFGVTGKFFSEELDQSSANGYAVDVGALYVTGAFSLGLNVTNFGAGLRHDTEEFPLPSSVTAGLALNLYDGRLRIASDLSKPQDNAFAIHQGVEYCYENTVFLRTGYSHDFSGTDLGGSTGMALGLGVRHSFGSIDYSYLPDEQIGDVHRISLRLQFGKTR